MRVDDEAYADAEDFLFDLAQEKCEGRIGFFLEGGYSTEVLSSLIPAAIERLSLRKASK